MNDPWAWTVVWGVTMGLGGGLGGGGQRGRNWDDCNSITIKIQFLFIQINLTILLKINP